MITIFTYDLLFPSLQIITMAAQLNIIYDWYRDVFDNKSGK